MKYYAMDENKNIIEVTKDEQRTFWENGNKKVAVDEVEVKTKCLVSTVFLFGDHNHLEDGDPILFETMVFDENRNEIFCERYHTYNEAIEGHKRAMNNIAIKMELRTWVK